MRLSTHNASLPASQASDYFIYLVAYSFVLQICFSGLIDHAHIFQGSKHKHKIGDTLHTCSQAFKVGFSNLAIPSVLEH